MAGILTAFVGPMFSGKTGALVEFVYHKNLAGIQTQVFKPQIDNRHNHIKTINSRTGSTSKAKTVKNPLEILELINPKTELIAIDEIQFFDETIVEVIKKLLNKNIDVAYSGLPSDFRGEPFGSVPVLLALSDKIVSLTAICTHKVGNKVCGQTATKTQRLIKGRPASYDSPIILVGDSESYTARCPKHHTIPNKPK